MSEQLVNLPGDVRSDVPLLTMNGTDYKTPERHRFVTFHCPSPCEKEVGTRIVTDGRNITMVNVKNNQ